MAGAEEEEEVVWAVATPALFQQYLVDNRWQPLPRHRANIKCRCGRRCPRWTVACHQLKTSPPLQPFILIRTLIIPCSPWIPPIPITTIPQSTVYRERPIMTRQRVPRSCQKSTSRRHIAAEVGVRLHLLQLACEIKQNEKHRHNLFSDHRRDIIHVLVATNTEQENKTRTRQSDRCKSRIYNVFRFAMLWINKWW